MRKQGFIFKALSTFIIIYKRIRKREIRIIRVPLIVKAAVFEEMQVYPSDYI